MAQTACNADVFESVNTSVAEQVLSQIGRQKCATRWMERLTYAMSLKDMAAVRNGAGLGFMSQLAGGDDPTLHEVLPPRPEWDVRIRLVTHVDLHRTTKVQTFLSFLKERSKAWCP